MDISGLNLPPELTGANREEERDRNQLGQDQFLELLTTQLQNQNPLEPLESGEFLGQLAQFGTVSGIQELQNIFTDIRGALTADRSIRAAELLGRDVLVSGDSGILPAGGELSGAVDVENAASNVTLEVVDRSGARVDLIQLGNLSSGLHNFRWDGLGPDGSQLPAGEYGVRSIASRGNDSESLETFISFRVTGVELSPDDGDLQLELDGRGSVDIDAVRRID